MTLKFFSNAVLFSRRRFIERLNELRGRSQPIPTICYSVYDKNRIIINSLEAHKKSHKKNNNYNDHYLNTTI